MPFRFTLFRAAEGVGPMGAWDREHREPLGRREEVMAALDVLLPGLRWQESTDMLFASGPFGGEEHALEITLFGPPGEMLMDIAVYSRPPAIRQIMSGLRLNYCYGQESNELYFPFDAGDHWPAAAR
jgi:hypothetical protein